MANSRIMLACKHCGEQMVLGKGYFGSYKALSGTSDALGEFFEKHCQGSCNSDEADCSDNARDHFAILEEGEDLEMLGTETKIGWWQRLPLVVEGKPSYLCSNCHEKSITETKYCPNCGAIMF